MTSPKPLTAREQLDEVLTILEHEGRQVTPRVASIRLAHNIVQRAIHALSAGQERAEPPALALAIHEFQRTRGKHDGEHDSLGGIGCGKCEAAYNVAEAKLDSAIPALHCLQSLAAPQSDLIEAAQRLKAYVAHQADCDGYMEDDGLSRGCTCGLDDALAALSPQAIRRALSQSELRETEPPTLEEFQAQVEEAVKLLRREGRDSE